MTPSNPQRADHESDAMVTPSSTESPQLEISDPPHLFSGDEAEEIKNQTILVVDDEQKNLFIMDALLAPLGHKVVTASHGREALEMVKSDPPDCILLDVMMPEMNGFTVCKLLKSDEATRLIPVIIVTAFDDVTDKVKAFESDADDFLSKPVNRHELRARVRSCLRIKALNDRLENSASVLYAFVEAMEAKDPYTQGHSERVSRFATDLANVVGLSKAQCLRIRRAGILHDIGKIGVPDAILNKPSRLTPEEFKRVQDHTLIGERICRPLRSFEGLIELIRSHHERLDGSGYPDGLTSSEISLPVRIMGIVDVFDALTSDRAYRAGLSIEKATEMIEEDASTGKLDKELVKLAIERFPTWTSELSDLSLPTEDFTI